MSLSLSAPLSLYSIPVVWFVGFFPTIQKGALVNQTVGYNNVAPRGNVARLTEKHPEIAARAARMESAHMNGNETFPLWAIAILAANYAQIDNYTLNIAALSYTAFRILYNWVYINQKTQVQGYMRTLVWTIGIAHPIVLLFKAANAIRLA
ncbi:hypothetical protein Hypma_002139 [Hypsizygus marmoreus]|uniref:Microsomal glutathione S-transferase 3 n=1 Tax=Hypsizygus marmoreus TaxID=39966 RepID=A0A369K2Y5_HYPMA|nr:hypothetical protein Hypma_002139 [Hypsizygus marmoreus]